MATKKKAFTLIELLAVIVILAIILVMAVPRILEVINSSKISTMEDSAKLIAKSAENKKLEKEILSDNTKVKCSEVAEYNSSDYKSCDIAIDNGVASIKLVGQGKFDGLVCTGTKDNMRCSESTSNDPEWLYAFTGSIGKKVTSYEIDEEKCKTIMQNNGMSAEDANTYCEGGEVDGFSIADSINAGFASQMESDGVIKNVVYGDWNDGVEEDYRNLKDGNGNQRPVFIKFKSDLSEKYVCTMYDGTKEDRFGTEPHCFNRDSGWDQIKTLLGNFDVDSNWEGCGVSPWTCSIRADYVACSGSSYAECRVYGNGTAYCGE